MPIADDKAAVPSSPASTTPPPRKGDWVLYLIAADKLLKAVGVVILGIIAIRLVHENLHDTVLSWATHLHIAPGNRYLQDLLEHTLNVTPTTLRLLGFGLFLYAVLYIVEGVGLAFRKIWAEWVVVIATTLFVPVEVYEIAHHLTGLKVLALLVNVLIVVYLLVRLRREHRLRHRPAAGKA